MKGVNIEKAVTFYDLKWDTDFFGVTSAKAILKKPLTLEEWNDFKVRLNKYQFVSIENRNSEPVNAQMIGKYTSAFLADVNIQFIKNLEGSLNEQTNVQIHQALERNDKILELAEFGFSKFIEDPELFKRGGSQVYRQWLINSFGNPNKYYALSKDENDDIDGFLLFSYLDNICTIELIAVSKKITKGGTGTSLFKAVECEAYKKGCNEIKVGTQMRNIGAINFYHKVGCKQVESHQVYHLWNL